MDTRGCQYLHFFSAIKRGSVTKVCNVNSFGNPALKFKSLKDVYESEDAKRGSSNFEVEHNKVKTEASCLPVVDRTLWKEDFLSFESVSHDDDEDEDDDGDEDDEDNDDDNDDDDDDDDDYDYDDDDDDDGDDDDDVSYNPSMTLRQLKGILRSKKRKLSSGSPSNVEQVYDNLRCQEDEFNPVEPLVNWKTKLSQNMPKQKRICRSGGIVGPKLASSVELDPVLGSESFDFANRDLMSLVCGKRDDPESESSEVPTPIDSHDVLEPNFDSYPDKVLEGHENKNHALVLYGDEYQDYFPDSSEDTDIDGCGSFQDVLSIEYFPDSSQDIVCVSDEIMGSEPCVVSSTPESDSNGNSDNMFFRSTAEIVTPQKDHICHVSTSIDDSHLLNKTSRQSSGSSDVQALDVAVNTEIETIDHLPLVAQTESFSLQQSVSSLHSHASYNHEDKSVFTSDELSERDQSRACNASDGTKDCSSPGNQFTSKLPASEKQPPGTVSVDPSPRIATFLDSHTRLVPVLQSPGRLTRKIIPPSSQERLSLTMDCEELHDTECKEKVFLEEKSKSDTSIARSNIENAKKAEYAAQLGQLNQRTFAISPNRTHTLQKLRNEKRGSPPNGNLEQPFCSRSLPCITTACTSVKSCSKGAIAFSQRQMNDVDSLAVKLLNELKSMKDILEQKLLLNSCRNLSFRNDADEVVAAIKTATRVEENAKRSLSLMARDCNRFCKIMSLTQDGPPSHENEISRERRKIVFADEAGERLCHVKFFENDPSSTAPRTSTCPSREAPGEKDTSICPNVSSDPLADKNVNALH